MADIPEDGPRKPRVMDPCNGCGVCCVAEPCALAFDYVPGSLPFRPCPALEWRDGQARCGLIVDPARHSPEFAEILAEAALKGPDFATLAAKVIGGAIRDALGDGECDSGFVSDDVHLDSTAAEFFRGLRL